MKNKLAFVLILFLGLTLGSPLVRAEKSQPLLDTKIIFDAKGQAKISYKVHEGAEKDGVADKIQSALIFYAYAMNGADEEMRPKLMNQIQKVVSMIATDEGLKRPDILKNNSLVVLDKNIQPEGKGFDVAFTKVEGVGNSLQILPIDDAAGLMVPSVFYYLQDLITNLPDSGLRLGVLALGGMNKWYREEGKAGDPSSISKAPSYGLNLAVDILAKLSGQKI